MQPLQKLIGMNIKLARTKRSIFQVEVANKIGIEASCLSPISYTKTTSYRVPFRYLNQKFIVIIHSIAIKNFTNIFEQVLKNI